MAEYKATGLDPNFGNILEEGARYEITWFSAWDTAYYAGSTALSDWTFWDPAATRNKTLRDNVLTTRSLQSHFSIQYLKITHQMDFTLISSEPVDSMRYYFEHVTRLSFKLSRKSYDDMPLSHFIPYDTVYSFGDTNTTFVPKIKNFFKFEEPLLVPYGGDFEVKMLVDPNLTTKAGSTSSPLLYNAGLTSNYGYYVRIEALGLQAIKIV